ncbi:MAG: M48 family metallopeptidase [Candidatus Symbiothrix sp.]|nr:M48 family metallopeptidase [Candidatus Symbiothrix sp.]
MEKTLIQFFAFIILFLGIWFGLNQIDFMNFFKVEEKTSKIEKALGDFYMDIITDTDTEITDTEIIDCIKEIKNRICNDNAIDTTKIKIHVVKSSEVNAFALPDRHIVIHSELISFCKNPEELAGILSHEIAHIEKNHIMMKLGKELGFSALSAMLSSGSGGAESLRLLTSTAYDRQMEEQADETGVAYLQKSKINPAPLADFMFRLSVEESDIQKNLTLISTHPETEQRARKILDLLPKESIEYTPLLPDSTWIQLQENIRLF